MLTLRKVGAAAGLAAPVLAFFCISFAILSYPAFSWTDNALSDLGVVEGPTMTVFNLGLSSTGILAVVFAAGVFSYFEGNASGKVGSTVFAAACVALLCIGIFNEHYSPTHYIVSVAFFSLAPIAFFILTGAFYLKGKRWLALFSVALGTAAAIPWILQFTIHYVPNVAIPEAISAAAIGTWAVAVSATIFDTKVSQIYLTKSKAI